MPEATNTCSPLVDTRTTLMPSMWGLEVEGVLVGGTTTGATNQAQGADGLGGCVPIVAQVNDVNLTAPLLPNFKDSATVAFHKDATNQVSASITPLAVQVEDSATGVNQTILDFNSTTPAAPSGTTNCIWQNDFSTGRKSCYIPNSTAAPAIQMQNTAAPAGNGIFVPFTVAHIAALTPARSLLKPLTPRA